MAAEAVLKVKEAEDKGRELIRKANEEAKEIVSHSKSDSIMKRKAVLDEAFKMKENIIETAVNKASANALELIRQNSGEKENILNPDKKVFEHAVEFVIERIMNLNGHS